MKWLNEPVSREAATYFILGEVLLIFLLLAAIAYLMQKLRHLP